MTHVRWPYVLTACLALGGAACGLWPFGPSGSVTGTWHYSSPKPRWVYEMSLTQSGDSISGTVCFYVRDAPRPRRVLEGVVTGDYPTIRFQDPANSNCTIVAKHEADRNEIAGDCQDLKLVRFQQGGGGRCEGALAP